MYCQSHFEKPCGYFVDCTPTERNAIEIRCPHSGGISFTVNQGFRYELWAEEALIKHYQNDYALSVSCISTALERFNEVFVKWSLLCLGLDKSMVLLAWKEISALSERQRGALSIARAVTKIPAEADMPPLPSDKCTNLRNRVVHGGYFPTEEEARNHATEILTYMFSAIRLMKTREAELTTLVFLEISTGYEFARSIIKSKGLESEKCVIGTLSFPYRLALRNQFEDLDFHKLVAECAAVNKLEQA